MQFYRDNAYLLHLSPYRDNSVLAHLLTKTNGKVSFIVNGMTAKKSNKRALLQPYRHLQTAYTLKSGLSKLHELEAETSVSPPIAYFMHCQYIHELLLAVLPDQLPAPSIFSAYEFFLRQLTQQRPIFALRHLEMALITRFAALPMLTHTYDANQPLASQNSYFLSEYGIKRNHTACAGSADAIDGDRILAFNQLLRLFVQHEQGMQTEFDKQTDWETLAMAAHPVSYFFISHLLNGKSLKTRHIYHKLRQMTLV